jgi:hypothetical protein
MKYLYTVFLSKCACFDTFLLFLLRGVFSQKIEVCVCTYYWIFVGCIPDRTEDHGWKFLSLIIVTVLMDLTDKSCDFWLISSVTVTALFEQVSCWWICMSPIIHLSCEISLNCIVYQNQLMSWLLVRVKLLLRCFSFVYLHNLLSCF